MESFRFVAAFKRLTIDSLILSFIKGEFEKCGRVVDVYNTGKGFAFVTFDRKEDAAAAIQELDGANVCGQSIKVCIDLHSINSELKSMSPL